MNILLGAKGFLIGVLITGGIGPIGLICIRRTLMYGLSIGTASGLGAAIADALYAILAIGGLGYITHYFIEHLILLKIIGGFYLLYLGIHTIYKKTTYTPSKTLPTHISAAFFSAMLLALANPGTLISLIALCAWFTIDTTTLTISSSLTLITTIFLGSLLWWLFLSFNTYCFRSKITTATFSLINITSGIIITLFGIATVITSFLTI